MSSHSLERGQERAALYALGALGADEHREFESHLRDGCEICAAEVRAFRAVTGELGLAARAQATSPELRARVIDRLQQAAGATEPRVVEKHGLRFVLAGYGEWQSSGAPKLLNDDAGRQYRTQLIRMDPGAVYPAHRHADVEEIYLLEGDLLVSGVVMHAGDYCRAELGSVHVGVRSDNGCLFIATFSARNERLAIE